MIDIFKYVVQHCYIVKLILKVILNTQQAIYKQDQRGLKVDLFMHFMRLIFYNYSDKLGNT